MKIYKENSFRKKNALLIKVMCFLVAFCYPFRKIIQNYLPIKEFLIMYLPTILIVCYYKIFRKELRIGIYITSIFLYSFIFSLCTVDYITACMWLINIILGILIADILCNNNFKVNDATPYIIGVLICNILLQPFLISRFGFNLTYMSLSRIPFIYGDVDVGPNGWSQLLSIAFLFTLMIIIYGKKNHKLLFELLAGLELFFLFQTQSRGSVLAISLIFFFLILIKIFEQNWISKKIVCKVLGLIFICFVCILFFIFSNIKVDLGRFSDLNSGERGKIWSMALEIFISLRWFNMLFGIGTGGTGVYLAQHNISSYGLDASAGHISAHSTYLDLLISLGIVGFILVIGYWLYTCWKIFKCPSKRYFIVFPLYILTSGLTYHMFSNWSYCICIAVTETILLKYSTNPYKILVINKNVFNNKLK